jgi:UDP:flavonoid glycosyltransferase YjiC (YdhE family)
MVNPILFLEQKIQNQTVLISALDWGMGHTTRCYAVVRDLLALNNQVIFAGNIKQTQWMLREFPSIQTEALAGYNIQLSSKQNTYLQLMRQFSQIKKAMKREKQWLANYCSEHPIDLIVSDNRYGFYHPEVISVLMTHQLNLQIPRFGKIVNQKLHGWIEQFDEVWVPDTVEHELAGCLSTASLNISQQFIGPLNRFQKIETPIVYDYLVILSGPEPERTHFLEQVMSWASERKKQIALVGAKVDGVHSIANPTTSELAKWIAESEIVISRAGYTTIMEMLSLNQKAILIPTKGQYEQEYLATRNYENISFVKSIHDVN